MNFNIIEVSDVFNQEGSTADLRRCFFDLEGSLTVEKGCILQIACIITDWDFNILEAETRYFKTDKEIEQEEQRIHGITPEMLDAYASEMFHEYAPSSILNMKNTQFVSFRTFDVKRIRAELNYRGVESIDFGKEVSSLKHKPQGVNLHYDAFLLVNSRLASYVKTVPEEELQEIYDKVSSLTGQSTSFKAHDAMFDTVALYHLCKSKYV